MRKWLIGFVVVLLVVATGYWLYAYTNGIPIVVFGHTVFTGSLEKSLELQARQSNHPDLWLQERKAVTEDGHTNGYVPFYLNDDPILQRDPAHMGPYELARYFEYAGANHDFVRIYEIFAPQVRQTFTDDWWKASKDYGMARIVSFTANDAPLDRNYHIIIPVHVYWYYEGVQPPYKGYLRSDDQLEFYKIDNRWYLWKAEYSTTVLGPLPKDAFSK